MNRIKPDLDVIKDILEAAIAARPDSAFINSLLNQYLERGGLSKKQLQGLYAKASKMNTLAPGKLATLEAVILKKPTRYKSALPLPSAVFSKDEIAGQLINNILAKFPHHKRVLYLKSKFDNNENLSGIELGELQKFSKLI